MWFSAAALVLCAAQVTIVEKADSSSVLPSPLSISTRNRMTFLFANLKDRDFLVQRISDFLQLTTSRIYSDRELAGSCHSSDDEVCGDAREFLALSCPRLTLMLTKGHDRVWPETLGPMEAIGNSRDPDADVLTQKPHPGDTRVISL